MPKVGKGTVRGAGSGHLTSDPAAHIGSGTIDRVPALTEPLQLHTDDGVELRGAWHRCTEPWATVVVVHGFSASAGDPGVAALTKELFSAGADVLVYDARGHGGSGGTSSIGSAEHLDVASAVAAVEAPDHPVILVGISMGAVAVSRHLADAQLRGDARVAGTVLISAPARWRMSPSPLGLVSALLTKTAPGRAVAARFLKVRVARRWRTGEPPEVMVGRVTCPVAVVHGEDDRLLSLDHARRLELAAGGSSRLDIVAGMGHGLRGRGVPEVVEAARWVAAMATVPAEYSV
jgi:uncharacterized protein